jgi:hypothetical protein
MGELVVGVLVLTGAVFVASSFSKLSGRSAYQGFQSGLRETGLVPDRRLPVTAAALASAEAVAAAALVAAAVMLTVGAAAARPVALLALIFGTVLATVLAAGVAVVVRRGVSARCNCFGAAAGQPLGRMHLIRNLSLLVVEVAALALTPLADRPAPAAAAIAAVAGVVLAMLFIRWEDLAALFGPISPTSADPAHHGHGPR